MLMNFLNELRLIKVLFIHFPDIFASFPCGAGAMYDWILDALAFCCRILGTGASLFCDYGFFLDSLY